MLEFLRHGLVQMHSVIAAFRDREEGQALVEYALILALVSVAAIGTLQILGTDVNAALQAVVNAFGAA
jgi:Flp pilus assembly pilin Flp